MAVLLKTYIFTKSNICVLPFSEKKLNRNDSFVQFHMVLKPRSEVKRGMDCSVYLTLEFHCHVSLQLLSMMSHPKGDLNSGTGVHKH